MIRHYILKDGTVVCTTCDRKAALDMIRSYQEEETHYMLRSSYSIIVGEEEFIGYPKAKKSKKATA